jgi:8-oxo-dGTP pyrophosphatase MutT (NUDIX family)
MRDQIISTFGRTDLSPEHSGAGQAWTPPPDSPYGDLTSAAVLVPLVDHPAGMSVLLTQRTETLSDHRGQIAFPGGRKEAIDHTPEDTALRETEEEVGISRQDIHLVGRLSSLETRTGYHVLPVIGLVSPPLTLTPEPSEVAHIFEVPLEFVLDPTNHRVEPYKNDASGRKYRAMPYGEHYIWGLTARVLFELADVLRKS